MARPYAREREQQKCNSGGRMLPISDGKHDVYGPDTLEAMGNAFDFAARMLPPNFQDHERARRKLALLILRHMDKGGPARDIGHLALLDFLRATQ
jgi:hypothetical protein